MKDLKRPDLVVLENFAVEPVALEDTRRMVEWLDGRQRNGKATLIVAASPPDEWDAYFAGDVPRAQLLHRVLVGSTLIELMPMAKNPPARVAM